MILMLDYWLVVGLRKRIANLANSRVAYRVLLNWIPAIVDHLYHVVQHTPSGQLRKDWWCSSFYHICNIHEHDFPTFPKCLHGAEKDHFDEDGNKLETAWLTISEYIILKFVLSPQFFG